jgi:diadenosine tetraphosphate (Ap4A) HIT family hydrolase
MVQRRGLAQSANGAHGGAVSVAGSECLICSMEQAEEDRVVFRDRLWAAEVVPGYEVPGWFVLRARRHGERFGGLENDELESFAFRVRDLIAAVSDVTNAPTTYMMMFGETYAHFHVLIAARGEDVPEDRRTGDLFKLRLEKSDPEAAVALVPFMRRAYSSIIEDRSPEIDPLVRGVESIARSPSPALSIHWRISAAEMRARCAPR